MTIFEEMGRRMTKMNMAFFVRKGLPNTVFLVFSSKKIKLAE